MDVVRVAHVLAQGVLLGGALLVWALPTREAARAYEWAFWSAVGVSVLTGVGNAAVHGLGGGLANAWGILFAAKLALVLAGLGVSAFRALALAQGRVWRLGYGLTALGVAAAATLGSVMAHRADRLVGFALGSMHAALFVVALILLGLVNGFSPFENLGTWQGALLYAWLWGVSVWTTSEAVAPLLRGGRTRDFLLGAVFWGGATGVAFLLALAAGLAALGEGFGILFILLFGGIAAAGIGGFVGLLAGLLDAALFALVRRAAR